MKKIFAFAMAIVSMAAVMTSCTNDDTEFIEQKPVPRTINTITNYNSDKQVAAEDKTEQVVEIFLPVTDVQLEMMDIKITLSMPNHTTTITPAEMTEVEFPSRLADNDAVGTAKLLKFRVPGTFTMSELRKATLGRTAKVNAEGVAKYKDQSINMFLGYTCTVTEVGKEAHFNVDNFQYRANMDMSAGKLFEKLMNQYQTSGENGPILY